MFVMSGVLSLLSAVLNAMTGKRIGERAAPRSSTLSLLAALTALSRYLAWLSDTIRCKATAAALALTAMLILLSPIAASAADGDGCTYLRNNPAFYDNAAYNVSSTGPTTIINQAPFGPQTGIVNFAAGTEVYYMYTVSDPAVNARLNRAPLAGVATVFVDTNISGTGSITLPVDQRSIAASAYVPGAGSGTVTWTIYCGVRTTQAVASATGSVGTAMSFTPVTASFGYGSYGYTLSGGTLPAGLAFDPATGAITGTPTAALAATTFTVTVTHQGAGQSSKTFQLAVTAAAPTIAAAFSPTSVATGGSSTLTLTITNPNAATQLTGVAVSAAALPANLTGSSPATTCTSGTATLSGGGSTLSLSGAVLNASASCTVSITVSSATPGNYSYTSGTVSASGPSAVSGSTATTPVPLTVTAPAPTVTSVAPTTGPTAGGTSVTITGTAFTGTIGAGGVRFGATNAATYTVNSDTQITAVAPAHAAGTVDVTVVAPGGTSATSASDQFTYVAPPVANSYTASAVAYDVSNATFSVSGHATNSPTFYAVGSATTAQGGSVSVDAAGLVTYTAPTGFRGNDSFTFTATNLGGTSAPATVTVPVSNPVVVSVFPVGSGTRGTALSGVEIDTSGGRSPYSCSTTLNSGALPAGTQLNSDCTISGTPAASGTFTFTASVTDSSLGTGPFTQATGPLVLSIAAPTITLSPASGALPGGSVGVSYSQSFTAGGGTSPYAYTHTLGDLPTGLTLSGGTLSGTPTATGTFNFDITATDGSSAGSGGPYSRVQSYSITMVQGGQTISFGPLPNASLSASPLTLSATASSGLTVDFASTTATICTVSGTTLTLHQMGTCSITASQAGDADWTAASDVVQSFTVTPANLVLSSGAASGNQVGASYSQANTATGGTPPYTYTLSSGALPGTSIDPNTGLMSGTPTMSGTFSYIVAVTDSQGTPVTALGPEIIATIAKGDQTTSFTSTAPSNAAAGAAAYTVTAAATSGLGVVFSLDGASTGCALSGDQVTFTGAGTCIINANQAGNVNWSAAPQVQQSFAVVVVPTVTGVSPPSGPVSQVVTVSGTGFSTTPGNNIVRFGGVAGNVTAASATSLTVTAPATGSGPAIVTVTVDGQTSVESVTFTFIDKPIAADRSGVVVAFNSSGTAIDLSGSISGGPHSSIAIGTAATHGTISIAGDVVTYTPTTGYTGPDSFTYTATGAGGTSNIATVSLEVIEAVPTAPTRSVAAQAGIPVTFDLTGGAAGSPFTGAAIVSVTPADAAEVELIEGGTAMNRSYSLRFTSLGNTAQAVTVLYTLSNGGGTSAPLTLIVQIDARPDPSDDPELRGLEAAETGAARRTAETQIGNFGRRMEQLHNGRCSQGMGVSLNLGIATGTTAEQQRVDDDPTQPGWIGRDGRAIGHGKGTLQAADGSSAPGTANGGTPATINADRFGSSASCDDDAPLRAPGDIELWSNGAVTIGSRDATTGRDRLDISTSGLTAGADIVLAPGVTIGIGGGYGRDQTDVGSNGSQVEASSWVAGAYGSFRPIPNGFIDVLAGAGGIDFDLTRYVTATDSFATAQRDADLFFGSVRAGIDSNDGPMRWSLYGGVEASRTNFGSYVEVGPAGHALAYDERGMDTINGLVGGRFEYSFLWGETVLSPRGRFEYRYDFEQAEGQRVRFDDWLDGPSFLIDADGWSRSGVTAELGIGAALPTGWQIGADVTGKLSGNSRSIGLRLEVSQGF